MNESIQIDDVTGLLIVLFIIFSILIFFIRRVNNSFFTIKPFNLMPKLFGSPSKKRKRPERTNSKGPSQELNMFVECPVCGSSVLY